MRYGSMAYKLKGFPWLYLWLNQYLYIAVKITFTWPGCKSFMCEKDTKKCGLPVPRNVDYINMPKRRRLYYEYSFVRDYGAY